MAGKDVSAMSTTTTGRRLEKELFIRATPERVWRALTEKAELEQWFLTEAVVDVRPGGALRFAWQQDVMLSRTKSLATLWEMFFSGSPYRGCSGRSWQRRIGTISERSPATVHL
jgi:hypothetical protein